MIFAWRLYWIRNSCFIFNGNNNGFYTDKKVSSFKQNYLRNWEFLYSKLNWEKSSYRIEKIVSQFDKKFELYKNKPYMLLQIVYIVWKHRFKCHFAE